MLNCMKVPENKEIKEKTDKNNGTRRLRINMKKNLEQKNENEVPNAKKGKKWQQKKY